MDRLRDRSKSSVEFVVELDFSEGRWMDQYEIGCGDEIKDGW